MTKRFKIVQDDPGEAARRRVEEITNFEDAVRGVNAERRQAKQHNERAKTLQNQALGMWHAIIGNRQGQTLTVRDDAAKATINVTLVEAKRQQLDDAALMKKVGARMWKRITKPVVDEVLLDQAIKDGSLDPQLVRDCMTDKPTAPYLKLTVDDDPRPPGGSAGVGGGTTP